MEEKISRDFAMNSCEEEIKRSDICYIGCSQLSEGMKADIEVAKKYGIPLEDISAEVAEILQSKVPKNK